MPNLYTKCLEAIIARRLASRRSNLLLNVGPLLALPLPCAGASHVSFVFKKPSEFADFCLPPRPSADRCPAPLNHIGTQATGARRNPAEPAGIRRKLPPSRKPPGPTESCSGARWFWLKCLPEPARTHWNQFGLSEVA